MDRSKIAAPGVDVTFARSAEQLDSSADVVVVDLAHPGALDAVRSLRAGGSTARIVAFGRHTERDVLAAAGAAGCDRVLARSAFFADVGASLAP
ncbi:MAG: hypothetical protein ACRD0G_10235 [Acidimicrobiales bacterium]